MKIAENSDNAARSGRPLMLDTPLASLRSSRKMTLRQVAIIANEIEPTLEANHGKLQNIEEHGTYDFRWVKALAHAYSVPSENIEAICRSLREL